MYLHLLITTLLSILIINLNALETPIIGILSQEAYIIEKAYPDAHSFIAASYVKLLESSGARIVPIWIGQDTAYYARTINYTNGILFPGGGTYFNESGGYGEAAKQLYKLAVDANKRGVSYPLWGICLGMQAIFFAAAGEDIRKECQAKDVSVPLDFVQGFNTSRLFSGAPEPLLRNLQTKNLTYNYHRYCILEADLSRKGLLKDWRIISKNKDSHGLEYVSTVEHKEYPFYGTQYHPEKNPFEFKKSTAVSHDIDAIEMAQYFANFFVKETRKNNQTFPSHDIEDNSLVFQYKPEYSIFNTSYEQLYLFKEGDYSKNLLK